MPELPEVEITRRSIKDHLVGATILYSIIRIANLRLPISKEIYTLSYQPILCIKRRAKYLLIKLSNGWIIVHLGMSGNLKILTEKIPAEKHDHIDLVINNGKILRYTDPRRFGLWLWSADISKNSYLLNLGLEPLSKSFTSQYLFEESRGKHSQIKPWLMNNKIVVGIGNIYANESLFNAKILPNRVALSLSKIEATLLVYSIKMILTHSIQQGGTTLRDFLHIDGKPGYFFKKLKVYGRAGQPCQICGMPIQSNKQQQRSTFFCNYCQK